MIKNIEYAAGDATRMELMYVANDVRHIGLNFHIYLRKRIPNSREFPEIENDRWQKIQHRLESSFKWRPDHRFEWNELNHVNKPHNFYGIHLKGGVTCYRSDSINKVQVIYDHDSDERVVDKIIKLFNKNSTKEKNRVGLIQMSYGTLNVKFVEYRPYKLEITPFLGEEIATLKKEMLQSFKDETKSGLYLIHGKPGTGKTSFLKEMLNETDKQALFIPPSVAGELGNPNLISLLMDHPSSILIIEDAETVLMKRKADNSDAVSSLLNLTDGFPSDILNLNIICTFNTDIGDIDPALLRKGRLRAIREFKALDVEHSRKLADKIGSDVEVNREMTVAEVCNGDEQFAAFTGHHGIGFNNN